MVAACASGKFALASDDEASPPALVERLRGGQIQIEFEHVPTLIVGGATADRPVTDVWPRCIHGRRRMQRCLPRVRACEILQAAGVRSGRWRTTFSTS